MSSALMFVADCYKPDHCAAIAEIIEGNSTYRFAPEFKEKRSTFRRLGLKRIDALNVVVLGRLFE